jgi:hypothetical protein
MVEAKKCWKAFLIGNSIYDTTQTTFENLPQAKNDVELVRSVCSEVLSVDADTSIISATNKTADFI